MTPAKPKGPAPEVRLEMDPADLRPIARYRLRVYRVLFSDGDVLDVLAHRDDSNVRAAILLFHGAPESVSIAGVACLEERDA